LQDIEERGKENREATANKKLGGQTNFALKNRGKKEKRKASSRGVT